ncbi:IS200/IS605 family element transposase accessory protein TnpB [Salicibibacter cibarius]|uniref:IS200/IS605 family element transposase accessory protein TnpB n=1 Tax=Salicibibacter cibarius TaxID=2743000 RepID=A0A7T6Z1K1_9BACI|nr:RNA-guided endonuclease TnpB family protein [Salicibibacter cibarius]QQK75187.1 IS200/IS605 family element transposase accessory protein TnpB [Salicibibacter cibarius]
MPVAENSDVKTYFPWLTKKHHNYRGTIQLLRKGRNWYIAIPIQVSSALNQEVNVQAYTPIGVDLGLRHLAVLSEPISGKRQFFSGKEVGYIRRHFRSLRRSLGKKKAQRAIERIGQKETRWMKDYNRKLAKNMIDFALQFDRPLIKMEALDDIRQTAKSMKKADRTIHSWAFYQLKQFIKERAVKHNIPVVDINPFKTSQTCFVCRHVEKDNRHRGAFQCKNCGRKTHADLNAANNIATSTSLAE